MDEYSDDGLDDLPENALRELEDNAIQSTQAASRFATNASRPEVKVEESYDEFELEDDDLDNTEVTNQLLAPLARPGHPVENRGRAESLRSPQSRWNSRSAANNVPGRQVFPQPPVASERFGDAPLARARPSLAPTQFNRNYAAPYPHHITSPQAKQTLAHAGDDSAATLERQIKILRDELNAAKGEAAILRSNANKANQAHAAEVARLRKQNAEQLAKQERLVEVAVLKEKNATTELQFLQRDMKEVTNRAKRKEPAGASTPKKGAKWSVPDGFDDMDLAASPSKTQNKGKQPAPLSERTPTKGKRKRPAPDSPALALETHPADVVMEDDIVDAARPVVGSTGNDPPAEFLHLILDHASQHGQTSAFNVLSRYSFPSDPDVSLSSIIFRSLPLLGGSQDPTQLLIDLCLLIIDLWARCVNEAFLHPVQELVSLLCFTLLLHTVYVAPLIMPALLPVAQMTLYMVADARARTLEGDLSKQDEYNLLCETIDSTRILSLLNLVALACAAETERSDDSVSPREDFWQQISLDMICLLLDPRQALDDIVAALDLLCASVVEDNIGPISADQNASVATRILLEKVSAVLVYGPNRAASPQEMHRVRLVALRTMNAFTESKFGTAQLIAHCNAIPRVVTALSAALDELYDQDVPRSRVDGLSLVEQQPGPPPGAMSGRTCSVRRDVNVSVLYEIISDATRLLHTLVTDTTTPNPLDINAKLATSHGGLQRYLLTLSRLNFAEEDLVFESGIDVETVEIAHELLELAVTPDEGNIISAAFGSRDAF